MKLNIFKLPPVEERSAQMTQNFLRRVFLPPRFTYYSDDTYILYECARTCFFMTGVLLVLNWVSFLFKIKLNLYFFEIDLTGHLFVRQFAWQFCSYTSAIIQGIITPYYVLKYFYNINPKQVDVTWWYVQIKPDSKKRRIKAIPWYLFGFTVVLFGLPLMSISPFYILDKTFLYHLGKSVYFMVVLQGVYWVLFSGLPVYMIFFGATLYRYIGPYSGSLSSSSIKEGKQNA